jgi:hypothetical protein
VDHVAGQQNVPLFLSRSNTAASGQRDEELTAGVTVPPRSSAWREVDDAVVRTVLR